MDLDPYQSTLLLVALERGATVVARTDGGFTVSLANHFHNNREVAIEIMDCPPVCNLLWSLGSDQARRDWYLVSFAWSRELWEEWELVRLNEQDAWDEWYAEQGFMDVASLRSSLGGRRKGKGAAARFNGEGCLAKPSAWRKKWETAWMGHVRQTKAAEQAYQRLYFEPVEAERKFFNGLAPAIGESVLPDLLGDRFAESRCFVQVRSKP